MTVEALTRWIEEWSRPDTIWYAKRLSANDTLATGAHQAGPYIPKHVLFNVFPSLNRPDARNPEVWFPLILDSHSDRRDVRAIWYNNRLSGGTRNEARITNLGGQDSPLLDPESTGALAVLAFVVGGTGDAIAARAWVTTSPAEDDLIEDRIGPVEPGRPVIWSASHATKPALFRETPQTRTTCRLPPDEIPAIWLNSFPSGLEVIRKAIQLRPSRELDVDVRLVRRRECEFEVFLSVEQAIELPRIRAGFADVDEFVAKAQTILQRRKSRSGRSLELHTCEILLEEGFVEGRSFSHQAESESGKRPDFLFPSEAAYKSPQCAAASLRMLAVKTTCKDRWRQILNEADRVQSKHLLTLQEGVSENQFKEMTDAGVRLVVPRELHSTYPASVRPALLSLAAFISEVRTLGG